MSVKLGLDAKMFRNTGTHAAPVWNEIKNVRDVTLSLETGEADATTRGNNGWRATVATLKDGSVEFDMVWDSNCSLQIGAHSVGKLPLGNRNVIRPERLEVLAKQQRYRGMSLTSAADTEQPLRNGESDATTHQQANKQPTKVFPITTAPLIVFYVAAGVRLGDGFRDIVPLLRFVAAASSTSG
ncbi:MAG: hypothetical protein ACYC3X_24050 [Pirellulaceae bacterium]